MSSADTMNCNSCGSGGEGSQPERERAEGAAGAETEHTGCENQRRVSIKSCREGGLFAEKRGGIDSVRSFRAEEMQIMGESVQCARQGDEKVSGGSFRDRTSGQGVARCDHATWRNKGMCETCVCACHAGVSAAEALA